MMRFIAVGGAAASLLALWFAGPAFASTNGVARIQSVTLTGDGCPAGSATTAVAPDGQSVTVTYNGAYTARSGPGVDPREALRTCKLTLQVNSPAGTRYQVAQASHQGAAALGAGSGLVTTVYSFQGGTKTVPVGHVVIAPPSGRPWQVVDTRKDLAKLGSAPCGGTSSLNADTSVTAYPEPANEQHTVSRSSTYLRITSRSC